MRSSRAIVRRAAVAKSQVRLSASSRFRVANCWQMSACEAIWRHTVFLNVGRRGAVEPGPKGVGRRHNHQGLERRWCRTWAAIHCGLEVVLEHALATDCRRGHRRSDLITSCDAYTSGRGVRWPWARLATNFVGRLRRGAAPDEGRRWKGDDRGGCTKECKCSGRPVGADLIAGAPPPAALFRFL